MVNETTTNEQGTCTFEADEGTVEITVSKEGFVDKTETINVTDDTTVNITLEAQTIEDDEEEVESRTVEFTVQDSEEQGISGARITLTNTDTSVETTNANGGTGSSGGSNVTLDYGTYNVSVTKENYTDATFTLTVDEELTVDGEGVALNQQGRVVITLQA
jgi:hypothetical protein